MLPFATLFEEFLSDIKLKHWLYELVFVMQYLMYCNLHFDCCCQQWIRFFNLSASKFVCIRYCKMDVALYCFTLRRHQMYHHGTCHPMICNAACCSEMCCTFLSQCHVWNCSMLIFQVSYRLQLMYIIIDDVLQLQLA
jgi:hypothetical protein